MCSYRPRQGVCEFCGRAYVARYPAQKFCSRGCSSSRAGRLRRIPDARCAECGVVFWPLRRAQIYCSMACRHRGVRDAAREVMRLSGLGVKVGAISRRVGYCLTTVRGILRRARADRGKEN